jgi:hypothetical protein
MVERKAALLDGAERGRRQLVRALDTARVHVPPGLSSGPLAFPWACSLAIGWGAPHRLLPPRHVPAMASRRRPGEE